MRRPPASMPEPGILPRPACGERVGVRGLVTSEHPLLSAGPSPLTRYPRAGAQIPTSPRRRGEVTGRFHASDTEPPYDR
jgi:hypothetical protein